jgi:hypothetical protein
MKINKKEYKIDTNIKLPTEKFEGIDYLEIGSKMYPLPEESYIFTNGNTRKKKLAKFLNDIDKVSFEIGRCYTNTKKLVEIGKKHDLNIKFYSGWVLMMSPVPIHHAWGVLEDRHGFKVFDANPIKVDLKVLEKLQNKSEENWRKEYARLYNKINKEYGNSEKMIMGKVLEGINYLGGPDNFENAINTFNDLMDEFPDHPSYSIGGNNPNGASELQKEILKGS